MTEANAARRLRLRLLSDQLAICRLPPDAELPPWLVWKGGLVSVTRSSQELSIVCAETVAPSDVTAQRGWRAFEVAGPLDFALIGILAGLAVPLSEAGISIFALSTYDTDYVLVRATDLQKAQTVLSRTCDVTET